MSADFEKVLVKDSRLDVSDSIKYAVIKGGQNVTMAQYKAISATNNQIVFNIQVPSEQTIIDRRVLLSTKLTLTVNTSFTETAATNNGCYYGVYSALASFPLHQLMTVMSATINNNTVSINIRDALPAMIRLLDCEDLVSYNSSSPTFADTFASYSDFVAGTGPTHPNASYWAVNEALVPHRGCFLPEAYQYQAGSKEPAKDNVEVFTWKLVEPLLLSPLIFSNLKSNNQGFYGIQNMNIVLNVGNTKRVFRGVTNNTTLSYDDPSPCKNQAGDTISGIKSVLEGQQGITGKTDNSDLFSETYLLFNFITPHPSDLLPARNIVPFYELPRYITADTVKATGLDINNAGGLNYKNGVQTFPVKTNSLQLNQIPDKLIVYVRKTSSKQSWGDADICFPITGISINFNNNSGILASAQPVDLWQMSRSNGLKESWNDFCGYGVVSAVPQVSAGSSQYVWGAPSVGSYLVLEFGKDIQLTEDFYAAGSLGNFNLQLNLTCQNNQPYEIPESVSNNVEVVLITMNSGVFVCERGTSSTYTGILTKQDVLEASQQEHYSHDDVERLVGGGFFDKIKSGFKNVVSKGKEVAMEQAKKHGAKLMEKGKAYAMKKGKEALHKYLGPEDEE